MVTVAFTKQGIDLEADLKELAAEWGLELTPEPHWEPASASAAASPPTAGAPGYRLLPEYMLRIHGVWCGVRDGAWSFERDSDATTWEDFVLMHASHTLAARHGSLLTYDGGAHGMFVEPRPESFRTFDDYAEFVTRKDEGLIKDMKLKWIYAHRTRYVR